MGWQKQSRTEQKADRTRAGTEKEQSRAEVEASSLCKLGECDRGNQQLGGKVPRYSKKLSSVLRTLTQGKSVGQSHGHWV